MAHFPALVLLLLSLYCLALANTSNNETLIKFEPKKIMRFENLGNQEIFHWVNEEAESEFLLTFSGFINQTGGGVSVHCADTDVFLFIRKDAIPIPNPLNTEVPSNAFPNSQENLMYNNTLVISQSEEKTYEVVIQSKANQSAIGHYFATAFLPKAKETIDVSGLTKNCQYHASMKISLISSVEKQPEITVLPSNDTTYLTRVQKNLFNVAFNSEKSKFNMTVNSTNRFYWKLSNVKDSGGVLKVNLKPGTEKTWNGTITTCVQNNLEKGCIGGNLTAVNSTDGSKTWYFPYPIAGLWYVSIERSCPGLCSDIEEVHLAVTVGSCIENCQASKGQGSCGLYRTDDVLFVSCKCKVGWRGIACTDGKEALSYADQLLRTLFLTLSNIIFLACTGLAIYRKYYTEALVYFFVAFMSTFYHACDQPGEAVYCIMRYETLQFSDFLSSITAIWFTLVAVAKPPPKIESFCHVMGCLGLAVGVSYDRFNLWTVVVPALIGVAIVASSWGYKCHQQKQCYPSKKKIAFAYFPGLVCAGTGLALYAFVETQDNYYIVHSMWHILMATAVLFLLPIGPKRSNDEKKTYNTVQEFRRPFAFTQTGEENTYHSYSDTSLQA